MVTSTYDDSDRLTSIAASRGTTTLYRFEYDYTKPSSGNPDTALRYRVTDEQGSVTAYTYDALNRLTNARTTGAGGSLLREYTYDYDGSGNRTRQQVTVGAVVQVDNLTYNAANQLIEFNGEHLSYDGRGNLTGSDLGAEFVYNAANQTMSIDPRPGTGVKAKFEYRGTGQSERIAAGTVNEEAGTGSDVCVPGFSCLVDPSRTVADSTFLYSLLGITRESAGGIVNGYYTRDLNGGLLAARLPAQRLFYLHDGLGSVVAVTDVTGTTVAEYDYDPFGNTILETGPQAAANPWRFTGAYLDPTGLYKIGERYYDPLLGRWTQQDPIINLLDPRNWNRYAYVGNDPINYRDPSGLSGCSGWDLVGALFGIEAAFLPAEAAHFATGAALTGSGIYSAAKILGPAGRAALKGGFGALGIVITAAVIVPWVRRGCPR
ncbi:MAG: RHS repeat-associated core domain-containing protein [Nitriliruptorales bacterium]